MAKASRPDVLERGPMQYAPENEQGVVFLFADYAKRYRIRIGEIRAAFPDCIAYQKMQGGEKKIRIEFEYKSKNFKTHGHSPTGCDWIVCWEDNWPDAPKRLIIIELRKEYGLGFNVWIVPVDAERADQLSQSHSGDWSVPSQAHKKDLVLFYLKRPESCIRHIYQLRERVAKRKHAGWKQGSDYMAPIKLIAKLASPIFLEDLQHDKILKNSGFVRSSMQGRHNATEYWPYLYQMMIRRNTALSTKMAKYDPAKL